MTSPRFRIAFQGAFGAFSHEACLACLPDGEPTPCRSFADAFAAVQAGDCALAFLPVENSLAGPVPEMAALLSGCGLAVLGEHRWPVHIQLLGVAGARLEQIACVSSHSMALKQCTRLIAELGVETRAAYDTAGAAQMLARSGERTLAVLASRAAGDLYALEILRADVEDAPDNITRFLVLGRPA